MKRTALSKERRAAFGPLPAFVAARMAGSARGQVARGLRAKAVCPCRPAHQRLRPQGAGGAPVLRPTLAERHHGPQRPAASTRAKRCEEPWTPRMGPPPGGTTTALLQPTVARHAQGCLCGAGAGGSGYGRRPHSRCHGPSRAWTALMALRAMDPIGCPASVGRRTYPGPPALARTLAVRAATNTRFWPQAGPSQRRLVSCVAGRAKRGGATDMSSIVQTVVRPALVSFAVLTALTGVVYPLVVTAIGQLAFPREAAGSLILRDGKPVGSSLIGQSFSDPKYFWGRPSATGPMPNNASASGGSNQGPLNPALTDAVKGRIAALRAASRGLASGSADPATPRPFPWTWSPLRAADWILTSASPQRSSRQHAWPRCADGRCLRCSS